LLPERNKNAACSRSPIELGGVVFVDNVVGGTFTTIACNDSIADGSSTSAQFSLHNHYE